MNALEPEVERKLADVWVDESARAAARTILFSYGAEQHERESARVRLAILKLSEGSLDKLRHNTAAAKKDYRDLLMWAEYPEESKAVWPLRASLTDEERQELENIRARDRARYDAWRRR